MKDPQVEFSVCRETHEVENMGSADGFACSFCDKKYSSRRELRNHSKCHTATVKNCPICDKPLKGYYYSVCNCKEALSDTDFVVWNWTLDSVTRNVAPQMCC